MKFPIKLMLAAALLATVPCIHAQSSAFSDGDKSFLKDSAQDDVAEVKLSELALQTSKDPTVTTFAKKVIDDHQKMLTEAKPIATKAGVATPGNLNVEHDAEYLKLKTLSGDKFDKTYIRTMVDNHHRLLESARTEHEKTQNEDMRRLAARAQEAIASQVEMVDRIAEKMGA